MNGNGNNDGFGKLLLLGGGVYAVYSIVNAVVAVITTILTALAIIAMVAGGIYAAYWLFRYINERQLGDDQKARQVNKLERKKKEITSQLPRHIRLIAKDYYEELEREVYEQKPKVPRSDVVLDRTKQVVEIFRRKESGK